MSHRLLEMMLLIILGKPEDTCNPNNVLLDKVLLIICGEQLRFHSGPLRPWRK